MDLFNPALMQKLKNDLKADYREFLDDLRLDIKEDYRSDILSVFFQDQLKSHIFSKKLDLYNHLNFYWLNLIDHLITGLQLTEDFIQEGEQDLFDELFFFWESSEFAQLFLEKMGENEDNLGEVSKQLIPLLEDQILSFFSLHISSLDHQFQEPTAYNLIPELGDNPLWIYKGPNNFWIKFNEELPTMPTLLLLEVNNKEHWVEIENEFDQVQLKSEKAPGNLKFQDNSIQVRPSCPKGLDQLEKTQHEFTDALDILTRHAPELSKVFFSFTHTLVPIDEPGIVSYSMQNLPGVSCLNVFERDFVDRIDDLLHENGHHYLNHFLNLDDLIIEDDDKIFFSPWRKALRPIRGLYHATFTFFWALELFHKLSRQEISEFSKEQNLKCHKRFSEEFIMIQFCLPQCDRAFELEKINEKGMDVLKTVYTAIETYGEDFKKSKSLLQNEAPELLKEVEELESFLEENKKSYLENL